MEKSGSYFDKLVKNFTLTDLFGLVGISSINDKQVMRLTVEGEEDVCIGEILDIKISAVYVTAKSVDGRLVSLWTTGEDNSKVYANVISSSYAKT